MNNSRLSCARLEAGLAKTEQEYKALVGLEREYMKRLRELKVEY